MLMRPLNGANAELTGRVSRAAARGVMAAVSAGNYTLSRCILAGLAGERGSITAAPGAPTHRGPDSRRYPPPPRLLPARAPNAILSPNQGPGAQPPLQPHARTVQQRAHTLPRLCPLQPGNTPAVWTAPAHTPVFTHSHPPTRHTLGAHTAPCTHPRGAHVCVHTNSASSSSARALGA